MEAARTAAAEPREPPRHVRGRHVRLRRWGRQRRWQLWLLVMVGRQLVLALRGAALGVNAELRRIALDFMQTHLPEDKFPLEAQIRVRQVQDAAGGNRAWHPRRGLLHQHTRHQGHIQEQALLCVHQLFVKEVAAKVWLPGLGEDEQVAVGEACDQEGHDPDEANQRAQRAEDQGDRQVQRGAGAQGADAIEILVFGLGRFLRLFLVIQLAKGKIFDQVQIPRNVQRLDAPLDKEVFQIEMCAARHLLGQTGEDLQRIPHQKGNGLQQAKVGGTDSCHQQDEHYQKVEIPDLHL
mmetsp:Transcript_113350/g.325901  ORF Transcript_113350/g.325901 Transcript_113350/m.325901 type:complete len:294 (-) Transcript_113350:1123-2004(-)